MRIVECSLDSSAFARCELFGFNHHALACLKWHFLVGNKHHDATSGNVLTN